MTFEIFMTIGMLICLAIAGIWLTDWNPLRGFFKDRSDEVVPGVAVDHEPSSAAHPGMRWGGVGQFDISPGESRSEDGERDIVLESSMQSFPASDPPAY